jgi:hypothetical protein
MRSKVVAARCCFLRESGCRQLRRLQRFGLYWEHHVCPTAVDRDRLRTSPLYDVSLLGVRSTCPALEARFYRLDRIRRLGRSKVGDSASGSTHVD